MGKPHGCARSACTADQDQEITRFLRANPDWLAAHPDLYRVLEPPTRVHGEAMADHMMAMILRERSHAETMTAQAEAVLAAGRATASILSKVHEAVLVLMQASDVVDCLTTEVPSILAVDALCLCRHGGAAESDGHAGRLGALLGAHNLVVRVSPEDSLSLYREAAALARFDLLIKLPSVGVLGLASRNESSFGAGAGQSAWQFLGQVIAAMLSEGERLAGVAEAGQMARSK